MVFTTANILLLTFSIISFLVSIFLLIVGLIHIKIAKKQPQFINKKGEKSISLGFYIEGSIFLLVGLLFLIVSIVLLIILLV